MTRFLAVVLSLCLPLNAAAAAVAADAGAASTDTAEVALNASTITVTAPRPRGANETKVLTAARGAGLGVAAGGAGLMAYTLLLDLAGPFGWAASLIFLGGMTAYLSNRRLHGHEDFPPLSPTDGPDPDALKGQTPLHTAAGLAPAQAAEQVKTIAALLDAGADVNALDAVRETPLALAAARVNPAVVELLLARGADPNLADKNGMTPLLWASAGDDAGGVVKALLDRGADPNAANRNKQTPLMLAIVNCRLAAVKLLRARGADPRGLLPAAKAKLAAYDADGTCREAAR